ncbi:oxidoreductase (NAD-dependent epimerase/dehydratase) [Legionella busanensis]|uniref:Oxidoreductase (NAD-dependent epimerase/dehydratase) n=1 Tax=Legionella busanensis TaxID=190655 RepID=A0A378JG90_9GAMM|nr:SDR family oxidoreductase [Legionella busanensis]STX50195.1 oxidoreductase (NAD-dependent epimerase/dehydratase) [Legionella busanensis]
MKNSESSDCYFIFGFGYTAKFLAKELIKRNFKVIGTTRDKQKFLTYDTQPNYSLINYQFDEVSAYLKEATHLLISIPPVPMVGDPVLSDFNNLIKDNRHHLKWLGYLSSTSVYGDHQGDWVDEESVCLAKDTQSTLRLNTEKAWTAFAKQYQLPLHIFRLAGIYGPGRNAISRIKAGKKLSIYKSGQFFSRIHVSDIVSVLLASLEYPKSYSIYNVADDEPTASHIIDAYACNLLKQSPLPLINYEEANLSPFERHFYTNNRRVANAKIKNELKIKLKYPTYQEGLQQLITDNY